MKKYNLSKIMKRAWELVKKTSFGISEALKKAWKEAKMGGTKMTGTEKQISFANDLIKKMNDALIAECKAKYSESVSMWESRKEEYNRILSESDAGLVIDLLKWNNETAYMKYYQRLMFDLKHERNTMCRRILSEVYGK